MSWLALSIFVVAPSSTYAELKSQAFIYQCPFGKPAVTSVSFGTKDPWKNILNAGKKLWIWNSNQFIGSADKSATLAFQPLKAEVEAVDFMDNRVVAHFNQNIQGKPWQYYQKYIFISAEPLPKQTWKFRSPTIEESNFSIGKAKLKFQEKTGKKWSGVKNYSDIGFDPHEIDLNKPNITIVESQDGDILLLEFPLINYETLFLAYRRQKGTWNQVYEGPGSLFFVLSLDYDGNGVPEIFSCGEGHYSCKLYSFYPKEVIYLRFPN